MNLQGFRIVTTFLRNVVRELSTVSYACARTGEQPSDAGVLKDGKNPDTSADASFRVFFARRNGALFVLRNISVDLAPNVNDHIRNDSLVNLFQPEFLSNGKEDAANNFARGHCTVRKEIIDKVLDRMKQLVNHTLGGGNGSVLRALNVGKNAVDLKFIPSPTISDASLATHCKVECENACGCDSVCYFYLFILFTCFFATD